jgi:hypothetical protein
MEWDEKKIDLLLDGKLMNHLDLATADKCGRGNPFHGPVYFILNQAIGGDNGGDPSQTKFPVRFEVDWVRVYQRYSPRQFRKAEYAELTALFFIQSMAVAIWMVPLSMVFAAHGLRGLAPYAFAASAFATFISPLIFGAMADRHASPVKVLRGLSVASAAAMTLFAWSVKQGWPPGLVLAVVQIYALCAAPTGSIITAIIFSRLKNSQREYGPVRAGATVGWMAGCWLVSALNADASTLAEFTSAATWLLLAAFTFLLPSVPPPKSTGHPTLLQRLGWDAFVLLKNHDHRVVFITVALVQHSARGLLSVHAAPPASARIQTRLRLDDAGANDGAGRHVRFGRTVSALAVEMDLCRRAGIWCAALRVMRAQWPTRGCWPAPPCTVCPSPCISSPPKFT